VSRLPSEIGSEKLPTADQVRTLIKTREQPPSGLLKSWLLNYETLLNLT
jgi:hypothetical protein